MIKLVDGNHQKKIDYTPTVDTDAGVVIPFGDTLTITSVQILANQCGAVNWPNAGAQYSIPNGNGLAFAVGADIFAGTGGNAAASGGLGKIGVVSRAAAAGDAEVRFVHER